MQIIYQFYLYLYVIYQLYNRELYFLCSSAIIKGILTYNFMFKYWTILHGLTQLPTDILQIIIPLLVQEILNPYYNEKKKHIWNCCFKCMMLGSYQGQKFSSKSLWGKTHSLAHFGIKNTVLALYMYMYLPPMSFSNVILPLPILSIGFSYIIFTDLANN